jgi:nicotinate-nucleotide adenylyltransferase
MKKESEKLIPARTTRPPGHVERVGIFGGSFDPVHLGHLILAEAALEALDLDRIIFIPAGISPFKQDRPPGATAEQRLSMLHLAVEGEQRFSVDDRELRREGPSYTIDTVQSLMGDHPGVRFIFLIGADNLKDLSSWRSIGELMNLVDFALLDRGDAEATRDCGFPVVRRRIDLSSTEIRERFAKGLSIRFMVPRDVYDFLMTHAPYRTVHGNA